MLTVYFDQNVFGHILNAGTNWRRHPLVECLLDKHPNKAQLWISPTHVLELFQCTDVALRQTLAQLMLALCGGRRMWAGPEYFLVEQFGNFLNQLVPGAFSPTPFFVEHKDISRRLWLGYLALLAAYPDLPAGPGLDELKLAKAHTTLMHARIAADPDASIKRIISCAENFETTLDTDPLGLDALSLDMTNDEIQRLRLNAKRPSRQTVEKLKKARAEVAAAYGAVDIGAALRAVFKLPCAMELTFDTAAIVAGWGVIRKATGCGGLPKETALAPANEVRVKLVHVAAVLHCCINAAAHARLAAASIGYFTILRELEVKLNNVTLPKGSIAFDADHALGCMAFNVFYCEDHALFENMRSFGGGIQRSASVVRGVAEFEAILVAS